MQNALVVAMCVLFAGCLGPAKTTAAKPKPAEPPRFSSGGASLNLGDTLQPGITRDEFLQRVTELGQAQRLSSARRLIERYPDVALEILQDATAADAAKPEISFIAQVHDAQCGAGNTPAGLFALLQHRAARPGNYADYDAARAQYREHQRTSRWQLAAALYLPARARGAHPLLALDAAALHARALLNHQQPAEAGQMLRQAIQQTGPTQPYQAAQLLLALSDAERRAGQMNQADAAWQQAVELGGELLSRPTPVMDANWWERAAELKPAQGTWPAAVVERLGKYREPLPGPVPTGPAAELFVWAGIGQGHLERFEGRSALVALKRAQALTTEPALRNRLELAQSRALLQIGQKPLAIAVLVTLTTSSDLGLRAAARASLGAIKLQDGSVEQALSLLQQAVENGPKEWPGRAQAEADFGLAYLSLSMEEAGLRWLHSAQQRFETNHEIAQLVQSLANERTYYQHAGKTEEAGRIDQRLQELENHGLHG